MALDLGSASVSCEGGGTHERTMIAAFGGFKLVVLVIA